MAGRIVGAVLDIAVRSTRGGPMVQLNRARVRAHGGIDGDLASAPDRGLTFLADGQWDAVARLLAVDLPWHTRRANVLVRADNLADLIGRTVALGSIRVEMKGETTPCGLMDRQHQGLKGALVPDCRAGVHGRVVEGGAFEVGDVLTVVKSVTG